MEFTNATDARAALLRTTFGEHYIQAAVIARLGFRIDGEELAPDPDLDWPVDGAPAQTRFGTFPADVPFLTGGVDVFVIGHVWQADGKPGTELLTEVRIGGKVLRRVAVIGNRRWVRTADGALAPGRPEPFVSMALSYASSFGGSTFQDNAPFAWPPNPQGTGFYLTEDEAEGKPLPNLEDPDQRIVSIEDRPEPMSTAPYPEEGSLRVQSAVKLDLDSDNPGLKAISPLMFNRAHPRMILEPQATPRPGDVIEVTNANPMGALRFRMPDTQFHAQVTLEERSYHFPLHLDQIAVLLDELRIVLGFRVVFQYRLVKGERRNAVLLEGPIPEGARAAAH